MNRITNKLQENISLCKNVLTYNDCLLRYPLPNTYTEVEYIRSTKRTAIVLDDVFVDRAQNIGLSCRIKQLNNSLSTMPVLGGGCYVDNNINYAFTIEKYNNNIVNWSPSNFNDVGNTGIEINTGTMYDLDLYRDPTSHLVSLIVKNSLNPYTILCKNTQKSMSVVNKCGPLGFFQQPILYHDSVGQGKYYGFQYNYKPTENGNADPSNAYNTIGLAFYSGIRLYDTESMKVTKFLYTCYKNETHQYGLYDAVSGRFYTSVNDDANFEDIDFYENNVLNNKTEDEFLYISGPESIK